MVTEVPPAVGPIFGETPVTEGGSLKVNTSEEEVAEVPASLVTVISVFPAEWAGDTAVICVEESTVKLAAETPLKATPVPATTFEKPVPVMMTEVPPATGPTLGETPVTEGGSLYVNISDEEVGEVPIFVVTVMSTCPAAWAGEVALICVSDTNV